MPSVTASKPVVLVFCAAAAVVGAAACGQLTTYGTHPGQEFEPEVPEPTPTPTPDEPEPTPEPSCPPTEAELQAEFEGSTLTADYGCAGCHVGQSPDGANGAWGAPTNDEAGWFAAVQGHMAREPVTNPADHDLALYFNNGHQGSTRSADAYQAMRTFLEFVVDDECDPEPGVEPDCTPSPGVVPTEEESEVYFEDETSLIDTMSCAGCHNGGSPTAQGQQWGGSGDWHLAFRTLYEAEMADTGLVTLGPAASDVINIFTVDSGPHPANPAAQAEAEAWVAYISTPGDPVVCEDECVPVAGVLPNETERQTAFGDSGLAGHFSTSCAQCHVGAGKTPDGNTLGWGATEDTEAAWLSVVEAVILATPVATPADHPLATRFNDNHAAPANNADGETAMTTFLEYTITEVGGVQCP